MSDGPHRSLKMRKHWKELCKRGDQAIYRSDEITEAAAAALTSDFRNEVSWSLINKLKAIFSGQDNSLMIPDIALGQLDQARRDAAGSVFGRNAIEWCITLIEAGQFYPDTVYAAIGRAAKERGFASARQIHEHVLRECDHLRADGITTRLNHAIAELQEKQLGAALMSSKTERTRASKKKFNLDDGVKL
jgi:hypothetical protein